MKKQEREEIINDIVGIYSDNLLHYKDGYEELEYKLRDKLETVSDKWLEKWYNDYMSNDTLSAKQFMNMLVEFLEKNNLPISLNNEIQESKMITSIKEFKQYLKITERNYKKLIQKINENTNVGEYALFNTKTNEIVGRGLTSDIIDYHLYKKNKIKDKYLKVIKSPSNDEVIVTDSGSLVFKDGYEPQFLEYNY